jgi:fatty-acyl-CoA synthase
MKGLMMDFPLTTHAILEYGNRVFPHKEIVTKLPNGSWHRYHFSDLYQRAKQLSSALVHYFEVQPGDRVATFAWNHYQHIELYYGIPGAGAICHTINIRLSSAQTEYIINNAEDRYLFVDASLVALLEPIVSLLPSVEAFILLNAPKGFTTKLPNCIDYEELIAGEPDDED